VKLRPAREADAEHQSFFGSPNSVILHSSADDRARRGPVPVWTFIRFQRDLELRGSRAKRMIVAGNETESTDF
jgi:hypothetical protein